MRALEHRRWRRYLMPFKIPNGAAHDPVQNLEQSVVLVSVWDHAIGFTSVFCQERTCRLAPCSGLRSGEFDHEDNLIEKDRKTRCDPVSMVGPRTRSGTTDAMIFVALLWAVIGYRSFFG